MPIELRPATTADAPVVLELIRELAAFEKLSDRVIATEADLENTLFSERPAAEVVLAAEATEVAGFALYFTTYSTFLGRPGLYLEDLYVRPQARRQGVGTALMRHLATIATTRNYGRFEWSCLNWNTDAIRFYAQLGAIAQSDWTVHRLDGEALRAFAKA